MGGGPLAVQLPIRPPKVAWLAEQPAALQFVGMLSIKQECTLIVCRGRRQGFGLACGCTVGPREVETSFDLNGQPFLSRFRRLRADSGALNRCMSKKKGRLGPGSDWLIGSRFKDPIHYPLSLRKSPPVMISVCSREAHSKEALPLFAYRTIDA